MFTFLKNSYRKFRLLVIVLIVIAFLAQILFYPDPAMTSEIPFAFANTGLPPFKPLGNFELSFMPSGNLYLANDGSLFQIGYTELFKARGEGVSWQPVSVGRYDSGASTLAFSPNFDEDRKAFLGLWSFAYGGATNSIRLSSDGGRTWRSPAMPLNGNVQIVATSPTFAADQTVYVSLTTDVFKLLRSSDGGEHWQLMTYPPVEWNGIRKLVISPYFALDQTLFAHFYEDSKLLRSADGGLTWQAIDQELGMQYGNFIYDLAAVPLGNNEVALIVATKYGLVITFDEGASWYLISEREFRGIAAPVDFAWTLTLFATDSEGHLYRTIDLGKSWHAIMPTNPVVESLVLAPDYFRDQTIYVRAGVTLWVSHDNGQTWQQTADRPAIALSDDKNQDIAISPQFDVDHTLFVFSPAWVIKSVDGGVHWYQTPLPEQGFVKNVAISPAYNEDQTLFVLINSTIYKSITGGQTWTPIGIPSCSATGDSFLRISPDYVNDHTIFIGIYGQGCGIYRSGDDGQSWQLITGMTASAVTDFDISPQYPSDPTMFLTSYNDGIFRSDDGGNTWINLTSPGFSPDFCIALSPIFSEDETLFVGLSGTSSGGAFRSEDRGQTWTDISDDEMGGFVTAVTVSPNYAHDQTVIMGGSRGIPYISEDAGKTWFPLEGTIANDVGIYGKKLFVAATYEESRLAIFATTPTYGVYKYYWPNLPQASSRRFSIGIDPNYLGPTSAQMPLILEDDTPLRYDVTEEANWLTITPLTGTLPTTLIFTADPGGSTLSIDSMRTVVTLELHLSYQQRETLQISVRAFLINSRVWLPLIMRGSNE